MTRKRSFDFQSQFSIITFWKLAFHISRFSNQFGSSLFFLDQIQYFASKSYLMEEIYLRTITLCICSNYSKVSIKNSNLVKLDYRLCCKYNQKKSFPNSMAEEVCESSNLPKLEFIFYLVFEVLCFC